MEAEEMRLMGQLLQKLSQRDLAGQRDVFALSHRRQAAVGSTRG